MRAQRKRRFRFKTVIQNPWLDWDPFWMREVSHCARFVAVRVTGLVHRTRAAGPYVAEERDIARWETAMQRLIGQYTRRVAFAVLQFYHYPAHGQPLLRGRPFELGSRLFRNWPRTLGLSHRLDFMLRWLRAESGRAILVHVEDHSARWVLESGFSPEIWAMDNPLIGYEESSDRWSAQLSRPGYLRRSRMPQLAHWGQWRMHIKPHELVTTHLCETGKHGCWSHRFPHPELVPIIRCLGAL